MTSTGHSDGTAPDHRGGPSALLFVGAGRSGTTVLEMLITRRIEVTGVGEVRWLWERGYRDDQLCSCGEPTRQCPFWSEVFELTRARFPDEAAFEAAVDAFNSVVNQRIAPLIPLKGRALRRDLKRARGLIRASYQAMDRVGGGRPIVDSSKDPTFAYLVRTASCADVAYVNMVRDSRAVVYSWQRKKPRPEVHWAEAEMVRPSVTRVALDWAYRYLAVAYLWPSLGGRIECLRYETFAADPEGTLQRVISLMERVGMRTVPGRDGSEQYHSVSGNPIRFEPGELVVKPDVEWRTKLGRGDYALTTVLTAPLLAHHLRAVRRERDRAGPPP
jgi:hypothetical protein